MEEKSCLICGSTIADRGTYHDDDREIPFRICLDCIIHPATPEKIGQVFMAASA